MGRETVEAQSAGEFSLIARHTATVRSVEQQCGMSKLTLSERAILRLVGEIACTKGWVNVTDVVRESHMGTPPTIFIALNKLERQGWLAREADREDGRKWRLVLTKKSKEAFSKMSELLLVKAH